MILFVIAIMLGAKANPPETGSTVALPAKIPLCGSLDGALLFVPDSSRELAALCFLSDHARSVDSSAMP